MNKSIDLEWRLTVASILRTMAQDIERLKKSRKPTLRTARLALLAGLGVVFTGCTLLPGGSEEAQIEKSKAWSLYIERSDQIEYLKRREEDAKVSEQ